MEVRRKELQRFLDKLLEQPSLAVSSLVKSFLSVEDENEYKSVKANEARIPTPTQVSEFIALNGKVSVRYNGKLERVCHNIHTGLKNIRDEFTKYLCNHTIA